MIEFDNVNAININLNPPQLNTNFEEFQDSKQESKVTSREQSPRLPGERDIIPSNFSSKIHGVMPFNFNHFLQYVSSIFFMLLQNTPT